MMNVMEQRTDSPLVNDPVGVRRRPAEDPRNPAEARPSCRHAPGKTAGPPKISQKITGRPRIYAPRVEHQMRPAGEG